LRAEEIDDRVEMMVVAAGEFLMGEGEDRHSVYVAGFALARYPVTNAAYQSFVAATGYSPPRDWPDGRCIELLHDHPVTNVAWYDALAYCQWLSAVTDHPYRLPTEAEWEKAARGTSALTYPWGNEFDKTRCNTWEAGMGRTTPVDTYPTGASPYGVQDLVGNVWEWCSSVFADYPYRAHDGREDLAAHDWRALRGGSWLDYEWGARAARRLSGQPDYVSRNTGFRVAWSL
jgi:formylglycine-generating enzyme required for sulfatase activity